MQNSKPVLKVRLARSSEPLSKAALACSSGLLLKVGLARSYQTEDWLIHMLRWLEKNHTALPFSIVQVLLKNIETILCNQKSNENLEMYNKLSQLKEKLTAFHPTELIICFPYFWTINQIKQSNLSYSYQFWMPLTSSQDTIKIEVNHCEIYCEMVSESIIGLTFKKPSNSMLEHSIADAHVIYACSSIYNTASISINSSYPNYHQLILYIKAYEKIAESFLSSSYLPKLSIRVKGSAEQKTFSNKEIDGAIYKICQDTPEFIHWIQQLSKLSDKNLRNALSTEATNTHPIIRPDYSL